MQNHRSSAQWYNGRPLPWLLGFAAYSILGLLFTSQVWIDYAYARQPLTWSRAGAVALADWYLWGLLTPGVIWLARRFRIDRGHWAGSLMVLIPVSLICTVAKQLADTFSAMAITGIARGPTTFMKIHVSFLTYWAIVGIAYAFEHYQKYRERELQAAHLQTALARAQVQSLQTQLQPHFLFNTLNTIAALMRDDVEAADVMIARLGDLLRVTLATAVVPEVPLRRELEFVDMYLDIQRARMGDRLTARVSADAETLDVQVPTLILQPLVENAIRHGAAARRGSDIDRAARPVRRRCSRDRGRGRRSWSAGRDGTRPRPREYADAPCRHLRAIGGGLHLPAP